MKDKTTIIKMASHMRLVRLSHQLRGNIDRFKSYRVIAVESGKNERVKSIHYT